MIPIIFSGCNYLKSKISIHTTAASSVTSFPVQFYGTESGLKLKIYGKNFLENPGIRILVDNESCTDVTLVSNTELNCTLGSSSQIKYQDVEIIFDDLKQNVVYPKAIARGISLGQPDTKGSIGKKLGISRAFGLFNVGNKFIVSDTINNRVLVWNSFPLNKNSAPDLAVGQSSLSSTRLNYMGTTASNTLSGPRDAWSDGTKLIVVDTGNHRVLIWNTFPTSYGKAADVVLGQSNFSTSTANNGPNTVACGGSAGRNACSLSSPEGVYSDGTKLFVADTSNHRVLIWNTIPTVSGAAADVVLGQPDFISGSTNNGPNTVACDSTLGPNRCGLANPTGIYALNGKLYVADYTNNRVLIWNTIPSSNQTGADLVLGQPSFTANSSNNGPNTVACNSSLGRNSCSLSTPSRVRSDGTRLFVADSGNSRVLIWNSIPNSNQQEANIVLGQPTFTTGSTDNGQNTVACGSVSGINLCSFNSVYDVATYGNLAIATDRDRNRLLAFRYPLSSTQAAEYIYGQGDSISNYVANNGQGVTNTALNNPMQVFFDGTKIYVSDYGHNRVLIWNRLPQQSGAAADVVLGQTDFTSHIENTGPNTAACGGSSGRNLCSLRLPQSIYSDGNALWIADTGNHRVLYWSSVPTTNQKEATTAIGQTTALTGTSNNGPNTAPCGGVSGRNACSFSSPYSLRYDSGKFFVADSGNNRILIFNSIPTSHPTPADLVLGQNDMLTGTVNNTPSATGTISSQSLNSVRSIFYDGTRLFSADMDNERILFWNTLPTAIHQAASGFIGQGSFSTGSTNYYPYGSTQVSGYGFTSPHHVFLWKNNLIITDIGNSRLLRWNYKDQLISATEATSVFAQNSFSSGFPNLAESELGLHHLNNPRSSFVNDNYLFIVDSGNDRVVILPNPWN